MEVSTSPGAGANGVPLPILDPSKLVEHLAAVVGSTLGASREELESLGSLLHESRMSDTTQRCLRFATDTQQHLYVQKDAAPSPVLESAPESSGMPSPCSTPAFDACN
ncbi:hypothetical protein IMZ48_03345 [Candidatus Bathyarchaeota archaeon]|nr:hypothetical protein [Candidatus Bathyarchaeota archaeon]